MYILHSTTYNIHVYYNTLLYLYYNTLHTYIYIYTQVDMALGVLVGAFITQLPALHAYARTVTTRLRTKVKAN